MAGSPGEVEHIHNTLEWFVSRELHMNATCSIILATLLILINTFGYGCESSRNILFSVIGLTMVHCILWCLWRTIGHLSTRRVLLIIITYKIYLLGKALNFIWVCQIGGEGRASKLRCQSQYQMLSFISTILLFYTLRCLTAYIIIGEYSPR